MKKSFPRFEDIDIKTFFEAMKQAYLNAEDYCFEAEILYRMRSYGHSLALSTLGIEELGKSIGYYILMMKKIDEDFLKENEDFEPNNLMHTIHKLHEKKQIFSWALTTLNHVLFNPLFEYFIRIQRIHPKKITKKLLLSEAKKAKLKIKNRMKNTKTWEKDREFLEEIQLLKEDGMYVGIKNENKELFYPKKIKAKDAKKCLDILDIYLDYWEYIPSMKWDDKIVEEYNELKNAQIKIINDVIIVAKKFQLDN